MSKLQIQTKTMNQVITNIRFVINVCETGCLLSLNIFFCATKGLKTWKGGQLPQLVAEKLKVDWSLFIRHIVVCLEECRKHKYGRSHRQSTAALSNQVAAEARILETSPEGEI